MYELGQVRKDCMLIAKQLGDYQAISTDDLANGYCAAVDAKDEIKKNQYMSALLLRFWSKISKLYNENRSLQLEYDDYFNWISMAIMMACQPENRVWQKNLSIKAETAINQTLATRFKAQAYYEANLDIKRANYNAVSLQTSLGSDDDTESTLMDIIPDEGLGLDYTSDDVAARQLIQDYIKNNKIVEAIIFDTIAYNDVEKITSKVIKKVDENGNKTRYKEYYHEFWAHKLVEILGNLPDNYSKYFSSKYSVATEPLNAAITDVNKSNNTKLYKFVRKALTNLKELYNY